MSGRVCASVLSLSLVFTIPVFGSSDRDFVPYPSRLPRAQVEASVHADVGRTLSASHYSLRSGLEARLLVSNQGPHPMSVEVRLFNRAGSARDLAPIRLAAEEARELNLRDFVRAESAWGEGSLEVHYQGKNLELGGVLTSVDAARSLIFDEELAETATQFESSRLEGVWWAPSPAAELTLALANTTDLSLAVEIDLSGRTSRRGGPLVIELAPHASRVFSYAELLGRPDRTLPRIGGISLAHSGAPGALLARAFVQEPGLGYSDSIELGDPARARSSILEGAGLRLGRIGRGRGSLKPALAVRNVTDRPVVVTGRIPVITRGGEEGAIALPVVRLAAREVREIELADLLDPRLLRGSTASGLELEYDGPPGSVVARALTVSTGGTDVFRLPLVDAARASATGIYPFRLDGAQTARVYIKNATAEPRDYTLSISYPGGSYVLGLSTLGPRQTIALDLKELRDRQLPDVYGHPIPREVTAGKVHWSMRGGAQHALIGRIEQADLVHGLSLTASCGACCPDSQIDAFIDPGSASGYTGETTRFRMYLAERNCFGSYLPWYPVPFSFYSSTNPMVATVDNSGLARAVGPGTTLIQTTAYGDSYSNCAAEAANEEYCCDATPVAFPCEAEYQVTPRIEIEIAKTPAQNDDVVLLQSTVPVHRNKVTARARAVGNPTENVTAVLTNPDGRLRFPDVGNATATLTLPASGAWVDFEISGESASSVKDDAIVEAHCNSATGPLCGSEKMTVFTFDSASIQVTAVGSYPQQAPPVGGVYITSGLEHTVNFEAQASIRPSGLDCTVAPIKNLRVGVMQNLEGSTYSYRVSDPEFRFTDEAIPGDTASFPEAVESRLVHPAKYNDAVPGSAPLYDGPGAFPVIGGANSQVLPGGCGQASPPKATTSDTPSLEGLLITVRSLRPGTTVQIGTASYRNVDWVHLMASFRTWAAILDVATGELTLVRETTWNLDVSSNGTTPQKASPSSTSGIASTLPVIDPPYASTPVTPQRIPIGTMTVTKH